MSTLFEDSFPAYESFKEPIRLRMLKLIIDYGPICSRDIELTLEKEQGYIARHLTYMRLRGVITNQRANTHVYYAVSKTHRELVEGQFKLISRGQLQKDVKKYEALKKKGELELDKALKKWT